MKMYLWTLAAIFCFFQVAGFTQVSDVSLPRQREVTVQAAVKLWSERGVVVTVPDPVPNPFEFIVEAQPESPEEALVADVPAVTGTELLTRLASRIPASGTFLFGGEAILLLGQKRLKAGDTVTISFEGRSYDLIVETIGSTTFTVRLGAFTHTRSTYISSISRP